LPIDPTTGKTTGTALTTITGLIFGKAVTVKEAGKKFVGAATKKVGD
jgi:hypothetical protein